MVLQLGRYIVGSTRSRWWVRAMGNNDLHMDYSGGGGPAHAPESAGVEVL